MESAKKVSDQLSLAGQVTREQLKHTAQQGFKSVVNLRSPAQAGCCDWCSYLSYTIAMKIATIQP